MRTNIYILLYLLPFIYTPPILSPTSRIGTISSREYNTLGMQVTQELETASSTKGNGNTNYKETSNAKGIARRIRRIHIKLSESVLKMPWAIYVRTQVGFSSRTQMLIDIREMCTCSRVYLSPCRIDCGVRICLCSCTMGSR